MEDTYYVWRRNDGYVGTSVNAPPRNWRTKTGEGISFEILLETACWPEALILVERTYEENTTTPD